MKTTKKKALIIRFSSLGDIVQCLSSAHALKLKYDDIEVHWAVRSDFATLLHHSPDIDTLHILKREDGLRGLIQLADKLHLEQFTHIYDAHSNIRSFILSTLLITFRTPWRVSSKPFFIRRSKHRLKRWLLFRWHISALPTPFRGANSFLWPLAPWGVQLTADPQQLSLESTKTTSQFEQQLKNAIILGPSAAWDNKRWPIPYWIELIASLPQFKFFILGGPDDQFCQEIADSAPERVTNLAGTLSWSESAYCISQGKAFVCGDTGLLHIADLLGKPCVALIGPSAFGYPSRPNSRVLEVQLPCKPCSKDGRTPCSHEDVKHCLNMISPAMVCQSIKILLSS